MEDEVITSNLSEGNLLTLSRAVAKALRHEPQKFNLSLDRSGWALVSDLASVMDSALPFAVTLTDIEYIVKYDAKGRYLIDEGRVRANQGHSFDVDLGLESLQPPAVLFHGTVQKFLAPILDPEVGQGLLKGKRQYVHLSESVQTATIVAARRGEPVILTVDAQGAFTAGITFFRSANGVWLVDHMPKKFLSRTS